MGRPKSTEPKPWVVAGISKSKYYREKNLTAEAREQAGDQAAKPAKRRGRPKKTNRFGWSEKDAALVAEPVVKPSNVNYPQAIRDKALVDEFLARTVPGPDALDTDHPSITLTPIMVAALRRELEPVPEE